MTYDVFGGTLNLAQPYFSLCISTTFIDIGIKFLTKVWGLLWQRPPLELPTGSGGRAYGEGVREQRG